MFNSLKKWVQDKAVDFTPPPPPPSQPSPSSRSFPSSFSKSGPAQNYYYQPTTLSYEHQQYNEHLSTNPPLSPRNLSRPISMDNVPSFKMVNQFIPPPLASPGELDLSHLNREEQEHIANVLRRARVVDEQQQQHQQLSILPVVVSSKQSPPASVVSASLSPSASSSSSTSTSSFHSEKQEKYDHNDKNDNYDDNEM